MVYLPPEVALLINFDNHPLSTYAYGLILVSLEFYFHEHFYFVTASIA